jgi:hypothetical protein
MRVRFHFKKASDALTVANVFDGEVSGNEMPPKISPPEGEPDRELFPGPALGWNTAS